MQSAFAHFFSSTQPCSINFDPDALVILATELTKKIQYQKEYLVAEIETKLNNLTIFQEQGNRKEKEIPLLVEFKTRLETY